MTNQEAHAQAFENGRKRGDAEDYARGKAEAVAESGDLISVKAARETCQRIFSDPVLIYAVDTTLKNTPAVAAQPVKRGQWLNWRGEPILPDDYWRVWRCSECGNEIEVDEAVDREEFTSNFCPNCGADMRGEGDA